MFTITKTFGAERGYSCAFRQWRATGSHCRFVHGYALSFEFTIGADKLDERGWVFDFGEFQQVKHLLEKQFNHTLAIAKDDPCYPVFSMMQAQGVCDLRVFDGGVGCERFAKLVHKQVAPLIEKESGGRAWLLSVTVREHPANSATYDIRAT